MDYDDSDFQSHNFQLVGEDSNKFPQSLRSLPLPKFELDEHLQLHLRFDSLVETEVLLDIQSQGNNWIEDFTVPVDSKIEFSSTLAESCLISRPKNVWSEATSSESVEMLLKSVGEDEMIDQKTIMKEADADDGLNGMDGQSSTCLEGIDSNSKIVDIGHTNPLVQLDESPKSLSLLCEDVHSDQLKIPDSPEPSRKEISETDRDASALNKEFNSETSIMGRQRSMEYATESYSIIKQAYCETVPNDDTPGNADDSLARAGTSEDSDFVTSNIQRKMNIQMFSEKLIEEESVTGITEETNLLADATVKGSSQIRDNEMNYQPSQASATGSGISNTKSTSFLVPSTESLMLNEGCNEPEYPENPGGLLETSTDAVKSLSKDREIIEIAVPAKDSYSLVMEEDGNIEQTSVGFINREITKHSRVIEVGSSGYGEPVYLSEVDATHDDKAPPIENIYIVDNREGTELNRSEELIEEKQDPKFELTDNNNDDDGDTSNLTEVYSSNDTTNETTLSEKNIIIPDSHERTKNVSREEVIEVKQDPKLTDNTNGDNGDTFSFTEQVHSSNDTIHEITLSEKNINIIDIAEETETFCVEEEVAEKQDPSLELTDNNNYCEGDTSNFAEKVHSSNDTIYEITLSKESINIVDSYGGTEIDNVEEVIEEKHKGDDGDTSKFSVEVHSSNAMSYKMSGKAEQDDDTLGFNSLASTTHNFMVIAKHSGDEVIEDTVKESGFTLNAPKDDRSEETPSYTFLDDAEGDVMSLSHSKSIDKDDRGELVDEPHNVSSVPPELASFVKENTAPTMGSGSTNSKVDTSIVVEEKEEASSAGLKINISSVTDSSTANKLIQDDPDVHALEVFPMDVVVEQNEATTTRLPAADIVQPDKELEIPGSTILMSKIDAKTSGQSDDRVPVDGSPVKNMYQDEPDVKQVSVGKALNFYQSEINNAMVVDTVEDQKEEETSGNKRTEVGLSSSVNAYEVGCHNELQSSIATHEHALQLEGILVDHAPSLEGNADFDSIGAFSHEEETILMTSVECASHGEGQTMPTENPSSEEITNKQQSCVTNDSLDASPSEVQCIEVGLSSSSLEIPDVGRLNELQSTISPHEHAVLLENNPVAHASSLRGNVDTDSLEDFSQKDATSITSGDALNHCTNSSPISENVSRSDVGFDMLTSESANRNSCEQDCGSPTFISCSGHSQDVVDQEGNGRRPDPADPILDIPPSVSSEVKMNDDKVKCCSRESNESTSSEDDRSFTFKVGSLPDLSERDSGNKWKPFPCIQSFEPPQSTESSERSHLESEKEPHRTTTKAPGDDNTRQVSGSLTTERIAISPGEVPKETKSPNQSNERDENPCGTPNYVGTANRNVQLEEMTHYSYPVPDLNTSVSIAGLFHQPFTDLQQVQLRAQIFVYGSLMQAVPPDEACMTSAFGESDGGRSLWEGLWRVCAERYQIQKSPFSSFETPSHSHSGIRVSEQVARCSSLQNKAPIPPSRSGNKAVSSAIANSPVFLPSPLWSVSARDGLPSNMPKVSHLDFNQALSPLHSHQSSQIRQNTSNNAPWLAQSPRPVPWAVSSKSSTLDVRSQSSILPVAETVQVTPARESSVVQIDSQRTMTTPGNNKSPPTVRKSRKRKKSLADHEEVQANNLVSQRLLEPAPDAGLINSSLASTSSGLAIPSNSPANVVSGPLVLATLPIASPTRRDFFSEETLSKVEQAKLLAEDASAVAASAVRHSQGVWSQLTTQRNSGLVSEADEKLASAAVAVAAAACVAKAAAAAAKVASDAALQAKLMADEILNSVRPGSLAPISETGTLDVGKSLATMTPASVLKGSSVISAAREAARRRVEAAFAATKRAENLDAIVRAAELAAEAVSQAGTIIAMGEPLPLTLSELIEAGPEGHWKVHKANIIHQEENVGSGDASNHGKFVEKSNEQPPSIESWQKNTDLDIPVSCNEHPVESEECCKGDGHEKDHSSSKSRETCIQKGSLVEVIVDEDGLRGAWFSAHVLDLKNGKAHICYNDLVSDEGTDLLKEWIPLEGKGDKAPRIRLAHPLTSMKSEGTRKRRRESMGNYVWSVGDRVDARMRDGWWEGIVTGKSQGDDTKLTVHFPDGGDSSIVRVWNLRPSLVWKDGHWVEWSHTRENAVQPNEKDTPVNKRQKLNRPEASIDTGVDGQGISKLSKNLPVEDSRKPEESRPLILSAKDRTFSVGKNGREDDTSHASKVRRTGLQKEGSRVVFGVPKPGKKRKFMEVSKHYTEDKMDKASEGNDSLKFAKYLMPQASRIWRNSSKMDPKGKDATESKPKGLKSVRSRTIQTRSTAEKDSSSASTSYGGDSRHGSLLNVRAALSNPQSNLEKKNRLKVGFNANPEAMNDSDVAPSGQPVPFVPSSKKKSSPAIEADIGLKGKLTPVADKSTRTGDGSVDAGKTLYDAPEPRRSSRRIQPTSRLLEGLQSSLTISKIPSFSHDKSTKTQHRGASSRGNAPHA